MGLVCSLPMDTSSVAGSIPEKQFSPGGATDSVDVDDVIIINVGGQRHETLRHTLDRHSGSRLSNLDEHSPHYRKIKDEYFFDRHPGIFAAILNYYRTGELHIPEDVCSPSVKNELDYWKIDEEEIEQCCWIRYKSQQAVRQTLGSFESVMADSEVVDLHGLSKWQTVRKLIWDFLEYPATSKMAKAYAVFSFMVTLLSITIFCCDSHPWFRSNMSAAHYAEIYGAKTFELFQEWYDDYEDWPNWEPEWIEEWEREHGKDWDTEWPPNANVAQAEVEPAITAGAPAIVTSSSPNDGNGVTTPTSEPKPPAQFKKDSLLTPPNHAFELTDDICMAYFCVELLVRFVFCPSKKRFFCKVLNFIDLISVIPFFIELIVNRLSAHERYKESVIDALYALRILRIFRLFRLVRHHTGLRVLVHTIRSSWRELLLLIIFLLKGMVLFASLIFYAEHGQHDTFVSIPHGFWWAIVTMTTLGYGDMVPKTSLGYFVGSICAVTGVLVIAFTVPTIVNNFLLFYKDVQYEKTSRRRKSTVTALYTSPLGGYSRDGARVAKDPAPPPNSKQCVCQMEENRNLKGTPCRCGMVGCKRTAEHSENIPERNGSRL